MNELQEVKDQLAKVTSILEKTLEHLYHWHTDCDGDSLVEGGYARSIEDFLKERGYWSRTERGHWREPTQEETEG